MNISGNHIFVQHCHLSYIAKLLNPFLRVIQDACFKKAQRKMFELVSTAKEVQMGIRQTVNYLKQEGGISVVLNGREKD